MISLNFIPKISFGCGVFPLRPASSEDLKLIRPSIDNSRNKTVLSPSNNDISQHTEVNHQAIEHSLLSVTISSEKLVCTTFSRYSFRGYCSQSFVNGHRSTSSEVFSLPKLQKPKKRSLLKERTNAKKITGADVTKKSDPGKSHAFSLRKKNSNKTHNKKLEAGLFYDEAEEALLEEPGGLSLQHSQGYSLQRVHMRVSLDKYRLKDRKEI